MATAKGKVKVVGEEDNRALSKEPFLSSLYKQSVTAH
jgi:hypothetical protein